MDEKEYGYRIDFAFLEKDENVLAVLLFGSGAKDQLSTRRVTKISVLSHLRYEIELG